ncbi:MAG: hypothetical protein NZL90_03145 [Aquificaceae bacterium]|nr:hypothetical protein [Aquificaceae bacterium]MDW8237626.1 hypothetical protein [Aquificaceae bacterium]
MGLFVEDLLNFSHLLDKEIEFLLTKEHLSNILNGLEIELSESFIAISGKKRGFLGSKKFEVRLAPLENSVKKEAETGRQILCFKALTPSSLKFLPDSFEKIGENVCLDIMPAVSQTGLYQSIPQKLRPKLTISRYRLSDSLKVYFKFEK